MSIGYTNLNEKKEKKMAKCAMHSVCGNEANPERSDGLCDPCGAEFDELKGSEDGEAGEEAEVSAE